MGSHEDPDFEVIARDAENKRRFAELFDNPGQAAATLRELSAKRDVLGGISTILLDNSTVDHAVRYFSDSVGDRSQDRLSARPRLMLPAVADFVNAVVLYENVLTGPESVYVSFGDSLVEQMRMIAQPVTTRLSWTEVFAALSLGKATATRAVREEGTIDAVAALLDTPVRQDQAVDLVTEINPTTAMLSPQTRLDLVADDDYYRKTISFIGLKDSQRAISAIDRSDGDGYWSRYESIHCHPNRGPELFAAHLIYRMYVYLYLADLLGCPYSADALRSALIPAQLRRGFAERVTTLAGEAQIIRDQQVNEVLGFEAFKVRIPLVVKYVLSRASKPAEVLEIALETRDSRPARRFREYGARVDAAIAAGNREDVARACAELSSYGVRLEADIDSTRTAQDQAVEAAKELVSVASPLLGAIVPGLALAAGQASTRLRRRKFAFLEQLIRTPRTLNEVEREFAHLWPRL